MSDVTTARIGRIALILAAILAVGTIGMRVWRDNAPAEPPVAEGPIAAMSGPDGEAAATAIANLQARTKANPNDAQGWTLLGSALFEAQRFPDAAVAYRRAVALKPDDAEIQSSLGEALFAAGPGDSITPETRTAFKAAIARNPKDHRARYFLGVARDLDGDHKGAIDDWFALLKDTPSGAPWAAAVLRTIEAVGTKNKIDVAPRLAAMRGTASNIAEMPADQQSAAIAGMVDGLAAKLKADPKNPEGWIMLMRSYATLGRKSDAVAAYRSAVAANPGAKADLDDAATTLGLM